MPALPVVHSYSGSLPDHKNNQSRLRRHHRRRVPFLHARQESALGITHLLDHVPYSDAVSIKRQMLAHFKQATYYRCRRKERMLDPSEQEYIRKLFVSKGIKELPVYDEYIEKYDW